MAAAEAERRGLPVLLVDPVGDAPAAGAVECGSDWRLALRTVYGAGRHARVVPRSEEESEVLAAAILRCGNLVAFWDELAFWSSGRSVGSRLEELIRTARHHGVVFVGASQFVGDLPSGVLNCAGQVLAFRCASWRACDRLRQEFGFSPDTLRGLPPREYLAWDRWAPAAADPEKKS